MSAISKAHSGIGSLVSVELIHRPYESAQIQLIGIQLFHESAHSLSDIIFTKLLEKSMRKTKQKPTTTTTKSPRKLLAQGLEKVKFTYRASRKWKESTTLAFIIETQQTHAN